MIDYLNVKSITELTREEFLDFIRIVREPKDTEKQEGRWLLKFDEFAEHPRGTDLLFYPKPGSESDEAVVEDVESYRRDNGLSGFKPSPD